MARRKSLADWIVDAAHDQDKDHPLSAIRMMHVIDGGPSREIHAVRFATGRPWTEKDVADLLDGKAEVFCQDMPGVQTFEVQAFYGTETSQPGAFFRFVKTGALEWKNGVTEAPDAKGQLQQGMRLLEAITQRTFGMQALLFEGNSQLVAQWRAFAEEMRRDSNELRAENRDAMTIIQDLVRRDIELGHEKAMAEKQFERETAERGKLLSFLPVIVNRILGRKVWPQASEDTAFVEAIGEHLAKLPPEDLMKLSRQLPAELWAPLMDRLAEFQKKKNAAVDKEVEAKSLLSEGEQKDLLDGIDFSNLLGPGDAKKDAAE